MAGYAVVDLETPGLFPGGHDRIVEVGVVLVSPDGEVEDTWETLLNPGRDLGRQDIHGICAADVLGAPTFPDVAGTLAELLRGRTFVAHNAAFDARFVAARCGWWGYEVPVAPETSVCTMQWGSRLLGLLRTLAGACAHLGVELRNHHSALADAQAAAGLLQCLLGEVGPRAVPWRDVYESAARAVWPAIPGAAYTCVRRGNAIQRAVPYLARLVDSLPEPCGAGAEAEYLALLDRALLDRYLSVREQAGLVAAAGELGVDQPTAVSLHRSYLAALARAALADGVVTAGERDDLDAVAQLLDLDPCEVDAALEGSSGGCGRTEGAGFRLDPGDMVVFTGEMSVPRPVWEKRAEAAGLVPRSAVTKKVKLVVAVDPDSLSGKARMAADYGIPIVTEEAFAAMLQRLGHV